MLFRSEPEQPSGEERTVESTFLVLRIRWTGQHRQECNRRRRRALTGTWPPYDQGLFRSPPQSGPPPTKRGKALLTLPRQWQVSGTAAELKRIQQATLEGSRAPQVWMRLPLQNTSYTGQIFSSATYPTIAGDRRTGTKQASPLLMLRVCFGAPTTLRKGSPRQAHA